jgi:CheY-like chemotaxis protein/putative methionine-R-sulfoxide reductase with GAF domain
LEHASEAVLFIPHVLGTCRNTMQQPETTPTSSTVRRVLVLTGSDGPPSCSIQNATDPIGPPRTAALVEQLRRTHNVEIARTIDDALVALRHGPFDLVLADAADFLPLERAIASQQAGLVLDTIGEGICLTDHAGAILWSNRRMRMWNDAVRARIGRIAAEAWGIFAHQTSPPTPSHPPAASPRGSQLVGGPKDASVAPTTENAPPVESPTPHAAALPAPRSKKFAFQLDDNQFFEVLCSPVIDSSWRVTQIVAICWDATSGRRIQQKIDAIDQAGRELVRLEGEAIARMNVGQRLKLLEEKIIGFCRQLMNFDHFAIRLLDRPSNKLDLVICVGMPAEAMEVELFAEMEGNGISGFVAATGRSYICPDVEKDPRYVVGLANARSTLTVPLMLHDKTIGIFNIESQQPAAFTEDDRQFAEIFGRYVAMALHILKLLVVERHTTTGQLAQDVNIEVSGPLNDIVSDVTLLLDEYIGNDEMRARLVSVLDNVKLVRQCLREVGEVPSGVLGLSALPPEKTIDPILGGKRILIADDEPNIRQTIHDLLARQGCQVDTASDGAEALALLASQARYDLVLSDIKMPHRNGYEIFAAAKQLNHSPPVILMTGFGYDPGHSIVRATQEGLAAVLFKPFKVEQLLGEVRKAVAGG